MPTEYIDGHPDRCEDFFADKTVLITGGTGFMGKVLVEKLLRACPKVKKVILLMRDKKGKSPEQRLKDIFAGPVSMILGFPMGFPLDSRSYIIPVECGYE